MDASEEDVFYADDDSESDASPVELASPWKILIVDDAKEIHDATKMVLSDVVFLNRGLDLISAYSAAQALKILETTSDIAVIFLDVVMEDDHAGLNLVQSIRQNLKNHTVRIILRTGQPGQAPERDVIVKYDINDYKNKSELTVDKLFTSLISALRSYQDITTIEASKQGLQRILEGSTSLLQLHSTQRFLSGLLLQINAIFRLGADEILCVRKNNNSSSQIEIATAAGKFEPYTGKILAPDISDTVYETIVEAFEKRQSYYKEKEYMIYFHAEEAYECVIYFSRGRLLSDFERVLMNMLCTTAAVGLKNIHLLETLENKVSERTNLLAFANQQLEEKARQLEQIASTDALTGIRSRRYFFEISENMLRTAKRHHRAFSIVIIDIDHFKNINDQFGHAAGDITLKRVATTCAAGLRDSDVFGRLGGEEFVIALPETELKEAQLVAERIQLLLKNASIGVDGSSPVTVSMGIAQWRSNEESVEFTLQRADAALYQAKRNGRNRIELG